MCCLVTAPHFNMLASALIIRRVTIIKPSRCSNLNLIRVVFVAFDADGASGCLLFPKLAASSWAEPMWTFKRVALCVQGNLEMSLPAQLAQRLTRGATFLFSFSLVPPAVTTSAHFRDLHTTYSYEKPETSRYRARSRAK